MTIDRKLARLSPIREPEGDRVSVQTGQVPVTQTYENKPNIRRGDYERDTKAVRKSGEALVDTGNSFNGFPQIHQEVRADAQTSIGYPNVSGNLVFNLALANVFRISLSGNATISVDVENWPSDAYPKTGGLPTGLEWAAVLKIDNPGGFDLQVVADHWAPLSEEPDLSIPGYYEICLTLNQTPGFATEVSAYPSIMPAVPE